jgi:hypothetical protein
MLSPYYARLRSEIERFGGTVEKFIGDAVMAVFGAPVAHEDDPERAVRAALAVRDAVQEMNEADPTLDLHVRIAVNTGEAVVALGARPSEGEGMVAGDVVNTAARLQTAAPVDGILVGEAAYRATERAIEYEVSDPVQAKGKSEPIPVWEAVAARARYGVDVQQAGGAPLVGRRAELDLLADALARAERERTPQLLTLVGVPGIGKSRLVWELAQAVDSDPSKFVFWRQGRSLPYGEGVAFWAVAEMVKAQAAILETDSAELAAAKLAKTVADVIPDPGTAQWVEGHVRPLVGLTAQAENAERDEAFSAWRRFFEALARSCVRQACLRRIGRDPGGDGRTWRRGFRTAARRRGFGTRRAASRGGWPSTARSARPRTYARPRLFSRRPPRGQAGGWPLTRS